MNYRNNLLIILISFFFINVSHTMQSALPAQSSGGWFQSFKTALAPKFDFVLGISPDLKKPVEQFAQAAVDFAKTEPGVPTMPQAIIATADALTKCTKDSIKTEVAFNIPSIKTFFAASVGATIAMASIFLIYKNLTAAHTNDINPHDTDPTLVEKTGIMPTLKKLISNQYVIGTTGIIAGLLLIAQSNRLAMLA